MWGKETATPVYGAPGGSRREVNGGGAEMELDMQTRYARGRDGGDGDGMC